MEDSRVQKLLLNHCMSLPEEVRKNINTPDDIMESFNSASKESLKEELWNVMWSDITDFTNIIDYIRESTSTEPYGLLKQKYYKYVRDCEIMNTNFIEIKPMSFDEWVRSRP